MSRKQELLRQTLEYAVDERLTPEERQALELYWCRALLDREVGERMGVGRSTVSDWRRSGLMKIALQLEAEPELGRHTARWWGHRIRCSMDQHRRRIRDRRMRREEAAA